MKEPEKMTPMELREAVAREVMGETQRAVRVKGGIETVLTWSPNKFFSDGTCTREEIENWAPCTPYDLDISAAFQVVEKMARGSFLFDAANEYVPTGKTEWRVNFACPEICECFGRDFARPLFDSLPRAICVAALRAVRGLAEHEAIRSAK